MSEYADLACVYMLAQSRGWATTGPLKPNGRMPMSREDHVPYSDIAQEKPQPPIVPQRERLNGLTGPVCEQFG